MNLLRIKRSWAFLPSVVGTVVILVVAVLAGTSLQNRSGAAPPLRLSAADASASPAPGLPTGGPVLSPAPGGSGSPAPSFEAVVTYEVTGDGKAKIQYNNEQFDRLEVAEATLPWRIAFPAEGPLMVVTAQRLDSDAGGIGCRIWRYETLNTVRSGSGPFARVGCVLTDD
ncbi:hypothetical protein Val02_56490 [Virgisporangium aliadipatigenens]|uniref:MmpS family membrane protein n=1 Tax=Virgisporangium aliadipatigenens TaxID=741659 RepID=A0A8J4DTB4_9ACTN|nr:MmpS family transport accessory protein [Virgisporangium aliadipatigenens]GIJ48763.1 hypothetical protein Val02_56490 [Virgisporangium aliadipatigenens]